MIHTCVFVDEVDSQLHDPALDLLLRRLLTLDEKSLESIGLSHQALERQAHHIVREDPSQRRKHRPTAEDRACGEKCEW